MSRRVCVGDGAVLLLQEGVFALEKRVFAFETGVGLVNWSDVLGTDRQEERGAGQRVARGAVRAPRQSILRCHATVSGPPLGAQRTERQKGEGVAGLLAVGGSATGLCTYTSGANSVCSPRINPNAKPT